jgi:hypothetical protein
MESDPAFSTMSSLSDEILLIIIELIERNYLPAFMKVSRQIRRLGTPVLYRFVQYGFPLTSTGKPRPAQLKYGMEGALKYISPSRISVIFDVERFIDTLERNHNLRRLVIGASLDTNENDDMWNQDPTIPHFPELYSKALISHLIELISPSLKYLEVKPSTINLSLLSSVPNAAIEIPATQIIEFERTTVAHLKALFSVGTLRHIAISWFGLFSTSVENLSAIEKDPIWKSAVGTSPVASLSFPSIILPRQLISDLDNLPLVLISMLITWPRQLECFHIGLQVGADVGSDLWNRFMTALLCHSESLEECFIDFRSLSTKLLPNLNMAGFKNLRRLGMAASFLELPQVKEETLELPTQQLWKLLPGTMEDLQLDFSAPFEHDLRTSEIFWAEPSTLHPTYEAIALKDSLFEILEHRNDRFPRLRYLVLWCGDLENKVTLQSTQRSHPHDLKAQIASDCVGFWLDYFDLPTAFREAGICLTWSVGPEPPLFNHMHPD